MLVINLLLAIMPISWCWTFIRNPLFSIKLATFFDTFRISVCNSKPSILCIQLDYIMCLINCSILSLILLINNSNFNHWHSVCQIFNSLWRVLSHCQFTSFRSCVHNFKLFLIRILSFKWLFKWINNWILCCCILQIFRILLIIQCIGVFFNDALKFDNLLFQMVNHCLLVLNRFILFCLCPLSFLLLMIFNDIPELLDLKVFLCTFSFKITDVDEELFH